MSEPLTKRIVSVDKKRKLLLNYLDAEFYTRRDVDRNSAHIQTTIATMTQYIEWFGKHARRSRTLKILLVEGQAMLDSALVILPSPPLTEEQNLELIKPAVMAELDTATKALRQALR